MRCLLDNMSNDLALDGCFSSPSPLEKKCTPRRVERCDDLSMLDFVSQALLVELVRAVPARNEEAVEVLEVGSPCAPVGGGDMVAPHVK